MIFKLVVSLGIVIVLMFFSKSKYYYISGLIPLFPTFALIAHYFVYFDQGTEALKKTIVFGLYSLIPYAVYLISLYFLIDRFNFYISVLISVSCWFIVAFILIFLWNRGII